MKPENSPAFLSKKWLITAIGITVLGILIGINFQKPPSPASITLEKHPVPESVLFTGSSTPELLGKDLNTGARQKILNDFPGIIQIESSGTWGDDIESVTNKMSGSIPQTYNRRNQLIIEANPYVNSYFRGYGPVSAEQSMERLANKQISEFPLSDNAIALSFPIADPANTKWSTNFYNLVTENGQRNKLNGSLILPLYQCGPRKLEDGVHMIQEERIRWAEDVISLFIQGTCFSKN